MMSLSFDEEGAPMFRDNLFLDLPAHSFEVVFASEHAPVDPDTEDPSCDRDTIDAVSTGHQLIHSTRYLELDHETFEIPICLVIFSHLSKP